MFKIIISIVMVIVLTLSASAADNIVNNAQLETAYYDSLTVRKVNQTIVEVLPINENSVFLEGSYVNLTLIDTVANIATTFSTSKLEKDEDSAYFDIGTILATRHLLIPTITLVDDDDVSTTWVSYKQLLYTVDIDNPDEYKGIAFNDLEEEQKKEILFSFFKTDQPRVREIQPLDSTAPVIEIPEGAEAFGKVEPTLELYSTEEVHEFTGDAPVAPEDESLQIPPQPDRTKTAITIVICGFIVLAATALSLHFKPVFNRKKEKNEKET